MKKINSTQAVLSALLQGRKINQWDHAREFATTRLGGLVFLIKKNKKLMVESEQVKEYVGVYPNPPVCYYCTEKSIHDYWKSNPIEYEFFTSSENG